MFNIGDAVIYANTGLCVIKDIRTEDFLGEKQLFYVLDPVYSKGSTIFSPVENSKMVIRSVVSKKELSQVLSVEVDPEKSWIENSHERRNYYSNVLRNCVLSDTLAAVRSLSYRKNNKKTSGKKLHMADEKALVDLEKMLYGEIAYVLDISYDEVIQMFANKI